jgi:hypothetical protein
MMRAVIISANSIPPRERGSDPSSRVVEWSRKRMETQIFLVGYDRITGFAAVFHPIPMVNAGIARTIAGLSSPLEGDWPLSPDAARQVASVIGTVIDTGRMDFCLEPHQPLEGSAARDAQSAVTQK